VQFLVEFFVVGNLVFSPTVYEQETISTQNRKQINPGCQRKTNIQQEVAKEYKHILGLKNVQGLIPAL
jgi:hypothetical protein